MSKDRQPVNLSLFEKGSVESTHKVPTSHYHTKHCHACETSLSVGFTCDVAKDA